MRAMSPSLSADLRACLAAVSLGIVAGCSPHEPPRDNPALVSGGSTGTGMRQPSCTLAWKAHGHTTQREAKAFAAKCLSPSDGAVDETLSPSQVSDKLAGLIPSTHELTSLVPRDIADFCPAYESQQPAGRALFWRSLITAIIKPESNYQTATAYWEEGQQRLWCVIQS